MVSSQTIKLTETAISRAISSPHKFNHGMSGFHNMAVAQGIWTIIEDILIPPLGFVDDVSAVLESKRDLVKLVETRENFTTEWGGEWALDKDQLLVRGNEKGSIRTSKPATPFSK